MKLERFKTDDRPFWKKLVYFTDVERSYKQNEQFQTEKGSQFCNTDPYLYK